MQLPRLDACIHTLEGLATSTASDTSGFRFESGCRPLQPVPPETATAASDDPNALRCDWPGCKSKRTFKRKYELTRHKKKHEKIVSYVCPFKGCHTSNGRSYYRLDKFYEHIRRIHDVQDIASCPAIRCGQSMPLFMIPIHALSSHRQDNTPSEDWFGAFFGRDWFLRDVWNSKRKCCLEGCLKWVAAQEMGEHILSHSSRDRQDHQKSIHSMGYDETGSIICPVCPASSARFAKHDEFVKHLTLQHLTSDAEGIQKFLQFNDSALERESGNGLVFWLARNLWNDEKVRILKRIAETEKLGEFTQNSNYHWIFRPNALLLSAREDIYEHRLALMRLYPAIVTHPVFDDIPGWAPSRLYYATLEIDQ